MLAKLCDLDQWSLDVVRYASAALASIAVGPDVKVRASAGWLQISNHQNTCIANRRQIRASTGMYHLW